MDISAFIGKMWAPRALWLFGFANILSAVVSGLSITQAVSTVLGVDPAGAPVRLNGESFQQDAVTTFRGWQYAAFYNATGTYERHNVVISRRRLPNGAWQHARFTDYIQKTMDGHNIISIGISPGDGRIHLSYDHHNVPLNYRVSRAGIATNPSLYTWSTALFGTTLHALPGAGSGPWTPLTYPRFERVSGNQLIMEFRIGRSGAGDSYLYLYSPSSGMWSLTGKYLQGADNNAYLNGLDFAPNQRRLHATWTWRETEDVVTNHDMMYAYSDDLGKTWRNTRGVSIATAGSNPITPSSGGVTVYDIPQNSGILNQEGQTVDDRGRVHVLNRESRDGGFKWYHYWRDTNGIWTRNVLSLSGVGTPTATGLRGKLVTLSNGDLIALLPNNDPEATEIQLWGATPGGSFQDWKFLWKQSGVYTEPLWDRYRIREQDDGVLSVFCRESGGYPARKVVVVDFTLGA